VRSLQNPAFAASAAAGDDGSVVDDGVGVSLFAGAFVSGVAGDADDAGEGPSVGEAAADARCVRGQDR